MNQQQMTDADFKACAEFDKEDLRVKAENYAISYHFSFFPENMSYEDLTRFCRLEEGDFNDLAERLNLEDELVAWEVFEDYNPSWVADQMDMMVKQLTETFA